MNLFNDLELRVSTNDFFRFFKGFSLVTKVYVKFLDISVMSPVLLCRWRIGGRYFKILAKKFPGLCLDLNL